VKFTTRFAPSPTGPLHLGHAYSALLAYGLADRNSGTFLLRIEDIDQSRARQHWEDQIYDDLTWLGLTWPRPVLRQSDRMPLYRQALNRLWSQGLLYPCTCNRKDIAAAANAPQEGYPLHGPDGVIYPGTCREKWTYQVQSAIPEDVALRLNMSEALRRIAKDATGLRFHETGSGPDGATGWIELSDEQMLHGVGDVVLARLGMGTSYHLSVVLDDAAQNISHVVRGQDLFDATGIHVVLQRLLGLETPTYHHHRLIRDETGKRLAKRDDARAIAKYRAEGATPEDVRAMVGL